MIQSRSFRPDIEGLRGVAVLCVVVFHAVGWVLPGGFVGVDVFFVLSGYLITGLLVQEVHETSRVDLLRFYARRVRRLLPAATIVTLVTLAAGALVMAPGELLDTAKAGRSTSAYLSNYYFAVNAKSYFAQDVRLNPMLHTWSLAVEEQFYLFWPLLFYLCARWREWRRHLPYVLGALAVLSFVASVVFTSRAPTMAFYGLPTRVWEFSFGALAVVLPQARFEGGRAIIWKAVAWAGLGIILFAAFFTATTDPFPGWRAGIPVVGTALALRAGANIPGGRVFPLDTRLFQMLGKLSYSWYLWHWPFLIFTAVLFPGASTTANLVAVGIALGAAAALHFSVENRARYHPALVSRPRNSVVLGVVLSCITFGTSMACMAFAKRLAAREDILAVERYSRDISSKPGCISDTGASTFRTCSFGPDSGKVVVLFGDSHGVQWLDAMLRISEERGWKLVTALRWGCPPVTVRLGRNLAISRGCPEWRDTSLAMIGALRPDAVIMVSGSGQLKTAVGADPTQGVTYDEWQAGTHRTLGALAAMRVPVLLIHDNPRMGFNVLSCIARAARSSWFPVDRCSAERRVALDPRLHALNSEETSLFANTRLFDLSSLYCPGLRCPGIIDGAIVYRDEHHLTASFALRLAPRLATAIDSLLASPAVRDP